MCIMQAEAGEQDVRERERERERERDERETRGGGEGEESEGNEHLLLCSTVAESTGISYES